MRPIIVIALALLGACDQTSDDDTPQTYAACGEDRSQQGCCVGDFGGGAGCRCEVQLDCDGELVCAYGLDTDLVNNFCVEKSVADEAAVFCSVPF